MRISLKADFRALERELGKLSAIEQPKVIASAMNKATAKGMTTAKREISKILGVKQGEFTKGNQGRRMFINRAFASRLETAINAVGRPFNLTRFGATPTGRGVQANVMGRIRSVPGAFWMDAKGAPIMRRKGKARLPITQIWGASAADALRVVSVQQPIYKRVYAELAVEYRRALRMAIRRIKGRVER